MLNTFKEISNNEVGAAVLLTHEYLMQLALFEIAQTRTPTFESMRNLVFRTRTQHLRYSYSTNVFRLRVRVPFH
jgi:hypothetical protein